MLGTIVNLASYRKAPRATFIMRHPVRAARIMKVRHDLRDAFSPGRVALGLGAAAAIPLGFWVRRRLTAHTH